MAHLLGETPGIAAEIDRLVAVGKLNQVELILRLQLVDNLNRVLDILRTYPGKHPVHVWKAICALTRLESPKIEELEEEVLDWKLALHLQDQLGHPTQHY